MIDLADRPTDSVDGEECAGRLSGASIIAFAKDWGHDPTSCNHVLRELAKDNRVLWLNSISTRSPDLRKGSDLSRIWHKLTRMCRGPQRVESDLWVYTPVVLPFHGNRFAAAVNRALLRFGVGIVARRLGMRNVQLWTWVPTSAHYLGVFGEKLLVYYCTDDWSQFGNLDGRVTEGFMMTLARRADVVFATSHLLVEKLIPRNPNTHLASHGVDHTLFAGALTPAVEMPPDLRGIPRPILGYYGLIEDWLDLGLIEYLARSHPEWSIVMLGKICVDLGAIAHLPNVHLLGRKPHSELPAYCREFAVGLIPHRVNGLTRHMNPIKLREYLSAGLPVVSVNLPEVRRYPDLCRVADTYEQFAAAVADAIAEDDDTMRSQRSQAMKDETWSSVVRRLSDRVRKSF